MLVTESSRLYNASLLFCQTILYSIYFGASHTQTSWFSRLSQWIKQLVQETFKELKKKPGKEWVWLLKLTMEYNMGVPNCSKCLVECTRISALFAISILFEIE